MQSKIRREPKGKDRVDIVLSNEIEKLIDLKPKNIIIVAGDHYYIEQVNELLDMGINVFLISNPDNTHNAWDEVLSAEYRISLSYKSKLEQNTLQCKDCGNQIDDPEKHRRFHHPNQCHICNKTRKGLKQHIMAKHEEYICEHCEKVFEKKRYRKAHYKKVHSKPYCEKCNREFTNPHSLEQHINNTTKH